MYQILSLSSFYHYLLIIILSTHLFYDSCSNKCYAQGPTTQKSNKKKVVKSPISTCINRLEDLPIAWQASPQMQTRLIDKAWSQQEQNQADASVLHGLNEMIEYQNQNPQTISSLWDNSVEAYIDTAYSAEIMPTLRDKSLTTATKHLFVIAKPYIGKMGQCNEVSSFITLVTYAHNLSQRLPKNNSLIDLRNQLVTRTNQSLSDCKTLDKMMGYHYQELLKTPKLENTKVYDMVMWSILFIDALTIKDLNFPAYTEDFVSALWKYLATYPMPDAHSFKDGANHSFFYDLAYLVTHIGYVPTGYGRHRLLRSHGEWIYRFLRANFYAVLEMGELDLSAEFVDLFRQYGCNETNDRQLRDGSRYLLSLYQKAGKSWLNHRESYESKESNPYDLMHKPWTAVAGLRRRQFEPVTPHSYGAVVKRLIGSK